MLQGARQAVVVDLVVGEGLVVVGRLLLEERVVQVR